MKNELYQLVAIDKQGKEYVIELKNENKNNKGGLEYIDFGTTKFKCTAHLAEYLYDAKKIPTKEVSFKIKYQYKGAKYLDVIFDDLIMKQVSTNTYKNESISVYCYDLLKQIETALFSYNDFYSYLIKRNNKNKEKNDNGNYLNQRLIDTIIEYYSVFVKPHNIDENKYELQRIILKELMQYKQLRTMHIFYTEYMKQKNQELKQTNRSI